MTPYYADDWLTVYHGDSAAVMAEMEPESIHCVVTSPPYFGLRDYGYPGQLGLEDTPEHYIEDLVTIFREVRRVLRSDGTVWLNLGDSYANDGKWGGSSGGKHVEGLHGKTGIGRGKVVTGLKPKDRMMIPSRVALALQADGWWLRDEIVWAKPNPMPSSVRDRTTPAHEMVYLLTKTARYWYDGPAIAEPAVSNRDDYLRQAALIPDGWATGPGPHDNVSHSRRSRAAGVVRREPPERVVTSETVAHLIAGGATQDLVDYARRHVTDREATLPGNVSASTERTRVGLNDRWDSSEDAGTAPLTRNKRSVWTIATQPYPEAHFATFPEALIEPMILAGCPEGGTVLDPFAGSGTTGLVAQRLSRRAVLIDLSMDYLGQLMDRNRDIPLGLGA